MPLYTGTKLAQLFQIKHFIGRGDIFDCYSGIEIESSRKVFCKIQRNDFTDLINTSIYDSYLEIWKKLSRAHSLNIANTISCGDFDGQAFLICEWIDGISLHDVALDPRRFRYLPKDFPSHILVGCLDGLAVMHDCGVLHRDISPHNILVSFDYRKIWLIDPAPELPSGQINTTAHWAAPELLMDRGVGPWSDLYSLGKVITEFCHKTGLETPRIVDRLIEPRPSDRPQTANAVRYPENNAWLGGPVADQFLRPAERKAVRERAEKEQAARDSAAAEAARERAEARAARPSSSQPPLARMAPRPGVIAQIAGVAVSPIVGVAAAIGASAWLGKLGSAFDKTNPRSPSVGDADALASAKPPASPVQQDNWSDRTGISNVPLPAASPDERSEANFIVMGPTFVARERSFPLELWVGPSDKAEELRDRASDRGRLVQRGGRTRIELPRTTTITAIMTLPGFEVANPVEQIHWDGTIRNTAFIVTVPPDKPRGRYSGIVKLVIDELPIGTIAFNIEMCGNQAPSERLPEQLSEPLVRYRTAFGSYSRKDTVEAFKRVQAIRAGQIDIFIDIANLRGGDRWQDTLMREIAAREVFYLFWSRNAAGSSWVTREWREALDRRGIDFICPIPLEDPRLAEPPVELSELHFNDWCLAIIRGEQALDADK